LLTVGGQNKMEIKREKLKKVGTYIILEEIAFRLISKPSSLPSILCSENHSTEDENTTGSTKVIQHRGTRMCMIKSKLETSDSVVIRVFASVCLCVAFILRFCPTF
jgi:hypothetical protein